MVQIIIGETARDVVATAMYQNKPVWVLSGKKYGTVTVSPIGSSNGEFFFVEETELLQVAPVKNQESAREAPVKRQQSASEAPVENHSQEAEAPPSIDRARAFLPEALPLWAEMEKRWPIIEELCNTDIYADSCINGFEELVALIERGERNTIPRDVEGKLNHLLPDVERKDRRRIPDRRKAITKAITVFIAYRKEYYPSPRWLWINQKLDYIDHLMNRFIDWKLA